MNQTTSRDHFINTTIVEGLANDVSPINKVSDETVILTNLGKNFGLNGSSRIRLFKGDWESFQESFIENISSDETTIVRTLTFGVCSSNHSESRCGFYILTNLLQEDTFTFQNRLQTQDLVRCKIDLV